MSDAVFGPWRKSRRSGDQGSCVELAWHKNEDNCAELARTSTPGAIRDSKNPDAGHLEVPLTSLISMAKSMAT